MTREQYQRIIFPVRYSRHSSRPFSELSSRVSKRDLAANWAGNAFLGLPFHALLRFAVSAGIGLYRCVQTVCRSRRNVRFLENWLPYAKRICTRKHAAPGRPTSVRTTYVCIYTRDRRCPRSRVTVALEATRVPFKRSRKSLDCSQLVPLSFVVDRPPLPPLFKRRKPSERNVGRSRTGTTSATPWHCRRLRPRDGIEHLASGRWIRILYKSLEWRFQVHSSTPRDFTRRLTKKKTRVYMNKPNIQCIVLFHDPIPLPISRHILLYPSQRDFAP